MSTTRLSRRIHAPRWSRTPDAADGTELVGVRENQPSGLAPADSELGWSMSIGKLAALVAGR